MGSKYEIIAWEKMTDGTYRDVQVAIANNVFTAIVAMIKAKRTSGCVTLKWR